MIIYSQYAEMLSLPDEFVDLLDEWGEAREIDDKNCHQRLLCLLWWKEAKRLSSTLNVIIFNNLLSDTQTARAHP